MQAAQLATVINSKTFGNFMNFDPGAEKGKEPVKAPATPEGGVGERNPGTE